MSDMTYTEKSRVIGVMFFVGVSSMALIVVGIAAIVVVLQERKKTKGPVHPEYCTFSNREVFPDESASLMTNQTAPFAGTDSVPS